MADVAVIGAGAAGLMAAALFSEKGIACDLYEKQERCGLKVGISGKGRCNLTNCCSPDRMRANILSGDKFLYSALSRYDSEWTMDFFEKRGLKLKIERGDRVFPVSDRALDVVSTLLKNCDKKAVRILREKVEALLPGEGGTAVVTAADKRAYRYVILATGGLSYPVTGSTGDGYRFAAETGHSVVPPRPSLTGFDCEGSECSRMSGLSLKNVTLSLYDPAGKKIFSDLGEALFTHFGISGPLALTASAHYTHKGLIGGRIVIDWKPGLSPEKLDARLLRDFAAAPNKAIGNVLSALLPSSAIPVLLARAGIAHDKPVNAVSRAERTALGGILKATDFTVTGLRPIEEAIVTAGGVSLSQVEPKTMESKLVKGLYFAGEVLDIDALTGGFNLQLAFTTAAAAVEAISNEMEKGA